MQKISAVRENRGERLSRIATAYFFLALDHRRNGKFEHFISRSEKLHSLAINEEPDSPAHRNNRALVREARGEFEAAFLDFRAAKQLCNGNESLRAAVEKNAMKTERKLGIEERAPLLEPIQIGIYTNSHYY